MRHSTRRGTRWNAAARRACPQLSVDGLGSMLLEALGSSDLPIIKAYTVLISILFILSNIATYNLPLDYVDKEQEILNNMTVEDAKALIADFDMGRMIYVVVGDAATQFERLKVSGVGNPILVDKDGNENSNAFFMKIIFQAQKIQAITCKN